MGQSRVRLKPEKTSLLNTAPVLSSTLTASAVLYHLHHHHHRCHHFFCTMWRFSHADRRNATPRPSTPTTSSSSSYRSSSSSQSITTLQTRKRKSMEELWQDITNESRPQLPVSGQHSFRSVILQDFLAGAFKSSQTSAASGDQPLSPTALSLNGGPGCPSGHPNASVHAAASEPPFYFTAEQRLVEEPPLSLPESERRHKRMMKNRESASRSRARKQAYTNELELEVTHLAEENTKLKQLNEELRIAMAVFAAQSPRKKLLQRTLSAP